MWLQGAYAEIFGYHYASSFPSGACGMPNLQAFVAALEATSVSVCMIAENWYGYTGGVTSDRHPEEGLRMPVDFVPTSPVKHCVPRISGGVYSGVTEVVSAVKNQVSAAPVWRCLLPRRPYLS